MPRKPLLVARDMLDNLLETEDGRSIGRVADVEARWEDGRLVLVHLVTGPQALIRRLASHLRRPARFIFRDRFDHRISLEDVTDIGPTIKLRRRAFEYRTGQADRWIARHLLRYIPGSGA